MARLFIDVQHGLSNRLRALASAAVLAESSDRELVVIWRPDHHCEARLHDLLDYEHLVVEDDRADWIRANAAQVFNYMEIEPSAQHGEPIHAKSIKGDIYVRSAYVLESPWRDSEAEARLLRSLRPSVAVLDLVASVPRPFDAAVHIRMATGDGFDHLSYESPSNWPEEKHRELTDWRKKSHVSRFVKRLDQLFNAKQEQTVFLAADLQETYHALVSRYGSRIQFLPRNDFDRSVKQLQHAMADLMLLTSAPLFLASTWSSFSDVAQILARPGRRVEMSGIDF